MENEHKKEQYSFRETLNALRKIVQDEIDPRTGDGRSFDAQVGKSQHLKEGLGIDTPRKALDLLKEAIALGYDPFEDNKATFDRAETTNTWSSHLSGAVKGEAGVGSVLADPGDEDDQTDLWLQCVEDMVTQSIIPEAITERAQREYGATSNEYWTNRLNTMTVLSMKLAAKRALSDNIPGLREKGFRAEDDRSEYEGVSERVVDAVKPPAREVGESVLRGFFGRRRSRS